MRRGWVAFISSAALIAASAALCAARSPAASGAPTLPPSLSTAAPPAAGAIKTMAPVSPGTFAFALDARELRATRTRPGYRLSGQAQVRDACTAARFTASRGTTPTFDVLQYRRPGTTGLLCAQQLTWVTAQPLTVKGKVPPTVGVRTQNGLTNVVVR